MTISQSHNVICLTSCMIKLLGSMVKYTQWCSWHGGKGGRQGCNRNIFQRGQSHFSWFFPRREMLFPGRKFPSWLKKKKVLSSFCNLSSFHFQFSTFPFSLFLPFCSIFPCLLASLFLVGQQKFPSQKSLGGTLPPCPLPVTPLGQSSSSDRKYWQKIGKE